MAYHMYLNSIKVITFFPVNFLGKKMVKLKLQEHELLLWHERTSQPEFDRFKRIHNTYRVTYFWKISKQNPKLLTACKSVVRIISCFVSSSVHTNVCSKCSKGYRKNSKNWDTLNYYRDCPTNGIVGFYSAILRSKDADRITNRVDTDQTAP